MVTAGGFALAALSPMPVGKQVFLLVIGPITTVMHGMTPAAATIKKAAFGRSKSPADAGKKIADCGSPSPALPEGTEKLKHTIKLKVDDGEIAVLPFIIYLF